MDIGTADLVVVDVTLGLGATIDAVKSLRRMAGDARFAPVVMTTANASPSMITQARQGGVNFVVAKPLAPRVLFERLVWIVKDGRSFIEANSYVGPDRRVRPMGPPIGVKRRRSGDLSAQVGEASTPNMSQADINSIMFPVRKSS